MSVKNNPSIVNSDLILHIDTSDTRSYVGPPIKNIATQINQNIANTSNSTFIVTNGTENVYIPTIGNVNSKYVDMYNDYNGGSGICCPSPFGFGSSLTTNGSTLHTYAIVYKSVNSYTHPNYMYRYEHNGPTYILEQGIFDTSKRIHLGDDWYWAWNTFTTNASTTNFNYCGYFMYEYARYNRLYLAKVLLCQGDYSTLHPSRWPEVNTTRSTTQAVIDKTGRSTITATGPFTYNTDRLTIPNINTAYLDVSPQTNFKMGIQDFTVSVWIKQLDNGGHAITEARDTSTLAGYLFAINYPSAGRVAAFINPSTGQAVYYTTADTFPWGSIQNVTFVVRRAGAAVDIYNNGTLFETITGIQAETISGLGNIYRIGYDLGGGTQNYDLYQYMHYSRALSPAEIRQNFNAMRGKYGV